MDEPSDLASDTAETVVERVERVNEAGTTVPIAEQNARAGLAVAERGDVLDQGTGRRERTADRLLDDLEVVELYLGG